MTAWVFRFHGNIYHGPDIVPHVLENSSEQGGQNLSVVKGLALQWEETDFKKT